jgi:predicted negative regulator of RcsB-dependent stress response
VRIAQGNLAAADVYCRQLDEATARYGSHTWVALASQARGELAAAQSDIEEAITYYTAAQAGFQEAQNEYAVAQCNEVLARLQ